MNGAGIKTAILISLFISSAGRIRRLENNLKFTNTFLIRAGREVDARTVFHDIVDEAPHLSPIQRRDGRPWIIQAKGALKEA